MPYGVAGAGGAVIVKPGYDASASSITGAVNASPTTSGEASKTEQRRSTDAASSVEASVGTWPTGDQWTGPGAVAEALDLLADPVGLGVDVESGERELDRVAEAAELVDAHLQLRRRSLAAHAGDLDPVGSTFSSAIEVRSMVTSGPR